MLDLSLVSPILLLLSVTDVVMHLYLDSKKARRDRSALFREPVVRVGRAPMAAVAVSTLLAFLLVLLISVAPLFSLTVLLVGAMGPLLDAPFILWSPGFVLLCLGIVLHGWSRWVRQAMASSWEMRSDQVLITTGPYSWVRHPSYTSYMLSFAGLFMMVPSLVAALLLIGIPGYYEVTLTEEKHLVSHFGQSYQAYMLKTGRFFPRLGVRSKP